MVNNRVRNSHPLPTDFGFEIGQVFRHGTTFIKVSDIGIDRFRLTNLRTLEVRLAEAAEMVQEYLKGLLIPCAESDAKQDILDVALRADDAASTSGLISTNLSDCARAFGDQRRRYIQALRALGYTCLRPTPLLRLEYARLQKKFEDDKAPGLDALYKCSLRIDKAGGDWSAAYPNFDMRGGRGKRRGRSVAVDGELAAVIKELRDDPSKSPRPSEIRNVLFGRLVAHGNGDELLMPSTSTLRRRVIDELGEHGLCLRIHGPAFTAKQYRTWSPRDRAQGALEVAEFDDKDCRVFAIDQRSMLPAGRIWLTAGVDQASDYLLGCSISDQPRNVWSAINAVANAVLPKNQTLPEWANVRLVAPFGKLGIAMFDNAMYNHSRDMGTAVLDISNGAVGFAMPRTPTEKSRIEGFNGRIACDFLPMLGAKQFKRQRARDEPEPINMFLGDFRAQFHDWSYNVEANRVDYLGSTSRERWNALTALRRPRVPCDIHKVMLATMLERSVKLRPEGLVFFGLVYQSPRIMALRRFHGHNASIRFRFDPNQLGHVYAYDAKLAVWFEVKSAYPELTNNLTLGQHQLIRKVARERGKANPGLREMLASKEKLKRLVEDARLSVKRKERAWASRLSFQEALGSQPAPTSRPVLMTDLEAQVEAIEDVVMESGDDEWLIPDTR